MTATDWLGMNNPTGLNPRALEQAHAVADAARDYHWPLLLELLGKDTQRINAGRIGGASGYAPLHQVAHGGAPIEVAQALISLGALRTLRTTDGQQAVDIARRLGHTHLLEVLTPTPSLSLAPDKLATVEAGVHQVIRERQGVAPLLERTAMRLPPLELLTETSGNALWFPVPGMYGGFHLRLGKVADEPVCVVDSWVRIVGGSEERRLVSTGGTLELHIPSSADGITISN